MSKERFARDGHFAIAFGGTENLVEDDIKCKLTLGGGRPSLEDALRRKMTFD